MVEAAATSGVTVSATVAALRPEVDRLRKEFPGWPKHDFKLGAIAKAMGVHPNAVKKMLRADFMGVAAPEVREGRWFCWGPGPMGTARLWFPLRPLDVVKFHGVSVDEGPNATDTLLRVVFGVDDLARTYARG